MSFLPPVFALGKSSEDSGISAFGQDTSTIAGIGTVGNFPVGTRVWTSEDDYSETQYRGTVLTNDNVDTITVKYTATLAGANPRLWKATAEATPTYSIVSPVTSRRELGSRLRMSVGGTLYRTASRTAQEYVVFSWMPFPTSDYQDMHSFLVTTLSDGLNEFTVSWYDYRTQTVRTATVLLVDEILDFHEIQVGLCNYRIELAIQTENLYT